MELTLIIIAAISVGLAIALAVRAMALPRIRAEESLGQIEAYGYRQSGTVDTPDRASLIPQLATRLGDLLRDGGAEKRETDMRQLLLSAGVWNMAPGSFIGYRLLAATASALLLAWMLVSAGSSLVLVAIVAGYAGFIGWIAPVVILKSRARRRSERIEIELPELIDLLVVTLEAGLGFTSALQRSAERVRGPLGAEIRLALHEHNLGLTVEQALQNVLERVNAPAVRAFVRAVTQGESLGVSIGQVMRELAGDLRTRRRQIIEEKAQKAPIKMLFPLAFLILPAIFVVVLFPGLYEILDTLGG
jgi:tight adherence protein C